jgi:hypothetical protein
MPYALPVLPVPRVVAGSLLALSLSKGSKDAPCSMLFPLALNPHWLRIVSGGIFCRWNFFTAILTIINKRAQPLCQLLLSRIPTGIGQWEFLFVPIERKPYFVSEYISNKCELRDVIHSFTPV